MERPILAAMLSVAGTSLSDAEKRLLEKYNPLGITLFGRNIATQPQLKDLCSTIKEIIGREDVLLAVDQEGGRIRRLREPEFRPYAAQFELGYVEEKFGATTAEQIMSSHAALISNDLIESGLNMNYAPVLDIAYDETSSVLKSRCFGQDEKKIAQYGRIMIDEYQKAGICPCIKHIPGHGRATTDPHLQLPILNHSLKEMKKDFYPFQYNKSSPAGMTAHIVIPEIDEINPVTQSAKGIDILIRGIIGFDGFLISDAIDMHALKGSLGERTEQSLSAGCDAICYCMGDENGLIEVAEHCHFLTDKSMIRFAKIKNIIKNNVRKINCEKIAQDYQKIMGNIEKYDDNYDATEILHKMKELNN